MNHHKIRKSVFNFKPFSIKQKKILTWWLPDSPTACKEGIIADGAIRSGKTVSMALSFIIWAMQCFNNQNFAMCGKTIGSFRRNVLFTLKTMLVSRGYIYTEHRTENLFEITNGPTTNYFYIFGGKDESSQDLIQGITLAGVFFDEVALMPESFVNQATGRCSVTGSRFWFNCNPDGPFHWFKLNWIDKKDSKNLLYLHFTMEDNLSLSEKIKQRYRNMYSGMFYDRYICGLWKAAEGVIYSMWNEKINKIENADDFGKVNYIAIDYGTQNPTVFLLFGQNRNNPTQWCCKKEYYYSGHDTKIQKTDAEYERDLNDFIGSERIHSIIVDPSAASFIALLRQKGYNVITAKNDVLDGIRFVATLLSEKRLFFHVSCINCEKEFNTYSWDTKAQERGVDVPTKQNDHAMDATRYFAYTAVRMLDLSSHKNMSR